MFYDYLQLRSFYRKLHCAVIEKNWLIVVLLRGLNTRKVIHNSKKSQV